MMLPLLVQAWRAKNPEAVKRVKGVARVGAWLAVVGTIVGFGLMRSAHADVKASSLAFGQEIGTLVDESGVEKDDLTLKLNGQSIFVHRATEPRSVHEVVAEYEKFCRTNPSSLGEMWGKGPFVTTKDGQNVNLPSGLEAGIIKEEGQKEGMIICVTKGANSAPTIAEAVKRFDQSQDLGDFGRLRYMYVKGNAKTGGSKVFTVWTEDSFKIKDLALEGDAEAIGSDGQLPRLPGARRVLNVEVVDTPYQVRVYEVKQSQAQVASFYDDWAKRNSFKMLAPEVDPSQKLRGYFRDSSQVMVGAFSNQDGKSYVSIAEVYPKTFAVESSK